MEPEKRGRFEQKFLQFTRLEEHFFALLRRMLVGLQELPDGDRVSLIVHPRRRFSPDVEVSASVNGVSQPVTVQVHGVRPVRYHVQTANTSAGRRVRRYMSLALGQENLNLSASVQTGPNLSLVYHVYYSEEVLRHLGA